MSVQRRSEVDLTTRLRNMKPYLLDVAYFQRDKLPKRECDHFRRNT
jgi:hypothetical protein